MSDTPSKPTANPPAAATIVDAVAPYRWRIGLTYGLTLAENAFALLYPFAIGLAIDGLISGRGWTSLLPLGMIWLAHIAVGAWRQRYDTRLFAHIYAEVTGGMIVRQRAAGVATSTVTARSVMAREAVDFVEIEIPALITALISLLGGIAMLFLYDLAAGAVMAGLLLPVMVVYLVYGQRALALSERLNNRHEREVRTIEDGRYTRVGRHFRALVKWRVLLSDAQVSAWSVAEFLACGAVMLVILQVTSQPGVQAGGVFAALAYVLSILGGLDEAPLIVERVARLIDIRKRVEAVTA